MYVIRVSEKAQTNCKISLYDNYITISIIINTVQEQLESKYRGVLKLCNSHRYCLLHRTYIVI